MKPSRYNHFIPFSSGQSIAYNALSNALALIDNQKLDSFYQFVENGIDIEDDKLREDLLRGTFLLEDDIDEMAVVRFNMLRGRYATNVLTLTIAPTSDCNFRCIYCYQKEVSGCDYMTESIEDAIVQLLESQKSRLQAFSVTWYGGEPLLALPNIQRLSERFIAICDEKDILYSANMITNGYLLTKEALDILKSVRVDFIQITLDGSPEQHNKKRPFKDGSGTFWTILNNLRYGYDMLPRVSLRINLDRDNPSAGSAVKNYLTEYALLDKVTPYFGCIRNDNDCYDDDRCINVCDFAEIEYDFALETEPSESSHAVLYPVGKSSFCGADRVCSFVISANGLLYKCWSDMGNPIKSVGNILEPFSDLNSVYLAYLLFDPTIISPCKECSILPICMGGCPFQRITQGKQQCSNHKYILDRCLKNAATKLISNRKLNA